MYYVYFLFLNNGDIYKGSTNDLKRRISEHRMGRVTSTKHKRPFEFIAYEAYMLKSDAVRREKFLKTTEGIRLLRLQLKDCLNKLNACHVV
jgi:putative endonuclease